MCVCTHVCKLTEYTWRSENKLRELVLSFNHMDTKDEIQIIQDGKLLDLLSHFMAHFMSIAVVIITVVVVIIIINNNEG